MPANTVTININLTSEQVKQYYMGGKNRVQAYTDDGQNISIPYDILLRFVTHHGIYGRFKISYDNNGKCQEISQVG
ncbi:MAG: DUF2835 family protein [Endozoicomonadaceae bacterium]|nr:DUF2835 family protein [Endozoicomonadaceae bacterium]